MPNLSAAMHRHSHFSFLHISKYKMSAHLSVGERWRVISMKLDQGMSASHIASVINCSTQTVYNILDLFLETIDMIERKGRGG